MTLIIAIAVFILLICRANYLHHKHTQPIEESMLIETDENSYQ